jgi:hypothetical protein
MNARLSSLPQMVSCRHRCTACNKQHKCRAFRSHWLQLDHELRKREIHSKNDMRPGAKHIYTENLTTILYISILYIYYALYNI